MSRIGAAAVRSSPATLFGPLHAAVQERAILADGKTFVDALPRRPVAAILDDFAGLPADDDALRAFVAANFELPAPIARPALRRAGQPLRGYIRDLWKDLARAPQADRPASSALPVRHPHVVPGGRFREIYYWDSFFSMLGLVRDGEHALANGLVEAMTDLISAHGYVPNGTRTYYLGRSQPPLYHMMVGLLAAHDPDVAARRLAAMKREHAWWMEGAEKARPGAPVRRVARLADGSLLNRYWDPLDAPRDESWREDVAIARASDRPAGDVYRDLRAGAESGWDFSSRWLEDSSLATIRTTAIIPIDLNAFLYGLETAIAAAGDPADARAYGDRASARRAAIERHQWDAGGG